MQDLWNFPAAPRYLLSEDPTKMRTVLVNGASIEALLASSTSVRGPHPVRLRLDECDEMKLPILDAALGQPMSKNGVPAQTVMSSTHQYPDGTMTALLKRSHERGIPLYQWCYRESMAGGWLSPNDIKAARKRVPANMWDTEYELQEPSAEGRAIQQEAVEWSFDPTIGNYEGRENFCLVIETPDEMGNYVTGVDWAKEQDWTVIVTYKIDTPWRLVAFERCARLPWPVMVNKVNARLEKYGGALVHDATGLGNVINDLLEHKCHGELLVGRNRLDLFSEYIAALENRELIAPRIDYMYREHKYCLNDDIFGSGHPPDTFVAGALAWRGRKLFRRSAANTSVLHILPQTEERRMKLQIRQLEPWAYDE
jgi:hypothetical protein